MFRKKITVQTFYTGYTSKEKANIHIIDDESYLKDNKELKDIQYLTEMSNTKQKFLKQCFEFLIKFSITNYNFNKL